MNTDKKIYTKCGICDVEINEPEDVYAFQILIGDFTDTMWVRVYGEQGEKLLGGMPAKVFVAESKNNKHGTLHHSIAEVLHTRITIGVKRKIIENGEILNVATQIYEKKDYKKLNTGLLRRIELYDTLIH